MTSSQPWKQAAVGALGAKQVTCSSQRIRHFDVEFAPCDCVDKPDRSAGGIPSIPIEQQVRCVPSSTLIGGRVVYDVVFSRRCELCQREWDTDIERVAIGHEGIARIRKEFGYRAVAATRSKNNDQGS